MTKRPLASSSLKANLPVPERPAPDEPPPLLRSWPRVYVAVILYLVALLAGLAGISRFFHYD